MFLFGKKQKEPENMGEILEKMQALKSEVALLAEQLKKLEAKSNFFIQKTGIVRYNPFNGVGGNQSFSIALLDANNDGTIISSIFSREGNRVYAKPVKQGSSEFVLSEEEKDAMAKAVGVK